MAFTYDISDTTDTSSKMRLELGDTRFEDGILPEGRNFSDAELDYFYSQESNSFWAAVARAFEAAAAEWSRYPDSFRLGPEQQSIPAAKHYADRAAYIRKEVVRRGASGVGSRAVTRSDGYSTDVDSVTV